MSFINDNTSEFFTAKITKRGRNSIAKGDFKISFFQIGDSEFDYNSPFNTLNGLNGTKTQKVFSPFDIEPGVKYPYKLDSDNNTTTYGTPIQNSYTESIRNTIGPAGFVTNHIQFNEDDCTGSGVMCVTTTLPYSGLTGGTKVVINSGVTFTDCEYVTLVFDNFCGTDPDFPIISGETNSLIYKIVGITGTTIEFDRSTPDLSSLIGTYQMVCNKCVSGNNIDIGDLCLPKPIDPMDQQDPWTLNVVWDQNIIGYTGLTNTNLTGFTGNRWVSTKQFLGYTTSLGQNNNTTNGFIDSFNEFNLVTPEEQRCLAVIHYSELGDIYDPERFFKYDDYISTNNNIDDSIIDDVNGDPITDLEYFEVYIPFILYHRNTGTTIGVTFHMGTVDKTIVTPTGFTDSRFSLKYRDLLDEQNIKVGKVFYNNKTIVFDDQELVAVLDYRSNRKHTLDAPKLFFVPSDQPSTNSLINGTSDQVFWVTYTFYNYDQGLNSLPCNYYTKISSIVNGDDVCSPNVPSSIGFKLSETALKYMKTELSGFTEGFLGTELKILVQETPINTLPSPELWKEIDYTFEANGDGTNYLDPDNIVNKTFIIDLDKYDSAGYYSIEEFISKNYFEGNNLFGDEQPFPGSIRVVRSTDIEVMNYLINLPTTQFTTTQNPTYSIGKDKMITDVTLLNSNKEVLVVAKTPKPIKRVGTQVFNIRLDF